MNWQDKGFLLNINKFNENSSISEFYTESRGKVSGIIFGSTSKKIKNYLFVGNKFHINYNSKKENSIGSFKVEIDQVNTPFYLNDKLKLFCILYSIDIIRLLSVENQKNKSIFDHIAYLFKTISSNFNIENFVFWELELLKIFGYELNYLDHTHLLNRNGKSNFVSKSDKSKVIPNFLINKNTDLINKTDLIQAFNLTEDFINKSVLNDNNLNIPVSRGEILKIIENL